MYDFRLLIAEDDVQFLDIFQEDINEFENDNKCKIDLVKCKNLKEAFEIIDNSFDGAIIDLRLDTQGDGDEGNKIIEKIRSSRIRIPVVILTGTPDVTDQDFSYIGVYKKGGIKYKEILNQFWAIRNTGLTNIMGGRGQIENALYRVFNEKLMPELNKWIEYGKNEPCLAEKGLLRHVLSYMIQFLDKKDEKYFPEEVYLTQSDTSVFETGSIVNKKENGHKYIVMTPTCDLVIRSGSERNTDIVLIAEIDSHSLLFPDYPYPSLSKSDEANLKKAYGNNRSNYYHWLPKTNVFEGGFINFRKIFSYTINDFFDKFDVLNIQISPAFVKDIIARFSFYYARQGQPEIEYSQFLYPSTTQMDSIQ